MSVRIFGDWASTEDLDQFDEYTTEPAIKSSENFNSLSWWQDIVRQERWPKLSEFAVSIFSFPPMSDEAERIFSGARRTISWDRARLEPEIIEALECYHHYLKQKK
jgi:hypothetical protein